MAEVILVTAGDWEFVYVDGLLVMEDSGINLNELLHLISDKCSFEYRSMSPSDEVWEKVKGLGYDRGGPRDFDVWDEMAQEATREKVERLRKQADELEATLDRKTALRSNSANDSSSLPNTPHYGHGHGPVRGSD